MPDDFDLIIFTVKSFSLKITNTVHHISDIRFIGLNDDELCLNKIF